MLYYYRHIAPLEQDPQLIRVPDAINMGTNDTDVKMSPHASGVILLRSENRNKMRRSPHSSGVLCKDAALDINVIFSELYRTQNYQENGSALENTTRGRQKLFKL